MIQSLVFQWVCHPLVEEVFHRPGVHLLVLPAVALDPVDLVQEIGNFHFKGSVFKSDVKCQNYENEFFLADQEVHLSGDHHHPVGEDHPHPDGEDHPRQE